MRHAHPEECSTGAPGHRKPGDSGADKTLHGPAISHTNVLGDAAIADSFLYKPGGAEPKFKEPQHPLTHSLRPENLRRIPRFTNAGA
jgi:hypothetical protein